MELNPVYNNVQKLILNSAKEDREAGRKRYFYDKKGDSYRKTSLDELYDTAIKFGSWMSENEIQRKHIVMLGMTCLEYIEAMYGVLLSNNVFVPVDCNQSSEMIVKLINKCDGDIVIFDYAFSEKAAYIKKERPDLTMICLQEKTNYSLSLEDCMSTDRKLPEVNEYDIACMIFTSGTTGFPKCVMLTNHGLVHNVITVLDASEYDTVRLLSMLPIHHAFGIVEVLFTTRLKDDICINDELPNYINNVKWFEPDMLMVPPMIVKFFAMKLAGESRRQPEMDKRVIAESIFGKRLKYLIVGGAHMSPKYLPVLREYGILVRPAYGMSECSPQIATCSVFLDRQDGSCGHLIPGVEAKTVNGELFIKGDNVMKGYYKDPEETAKVLNDGWFQTGDIGSVDKDGYVFVTGRKKNLIVLSNGENINPEIIENQILEEYPQIKEVLVYGEDDHIKAKIYPDVDSFTGEEEIKKMIDKINEGLPTYSKIAQFKISEVPLEKTSSNKLKRNM